MIPLEVLHTAAMYPVILEGLRPGERGHHDNLLWFCERDDSPHLLHPVCFALGRGWRSG